MQDQLMHTRRHIPDFIRPSKLVTPLRDLIPLNSKKERLSSATPTTTRTGALELIPLDQVQKSQSRQAPGIAAEQTYAHSRSTKILASSQLSSRAIVRRDEVLKLIEQVYDGSDRGKQLLMKRKLLYKEYRSLCELIEESKDDAFRAFFNHQLRYDYGRYEKDEQFVIRMASAYHDTVAGSINTHITDWLKDVREERSLYNGAICRDTETVDVATKIKATLATKVKLSSQPHPDKKHPDLSFRFRHPDTKKPGLVVEVAWSQRSLNLPKIARNYIERTNGQVRTVIGIDLYHISESKRVGGLYTGRATFSVWKAKFNSSGKAVFTCAVQDQASLSTSLRVDYLANSKSQPFRDEGGNTNPEGVLRLSLRDFICEKTVEKLEEFPDPELVISAETLCEYFVEALEQGQAEERDDEEDGSKCGW